MKNAYIHGRMGSFFNRKRACDGEKSVRLLVARRLRQNLRHVAHRVNLWTLLMLMAFLSQGNERVIEAPNLISVAA